MKFSRGSARMGDLTLSVLDPRHPRQPFFVSSKIFAARENLNG
jgi:hypothetical protein